MLEERKRTQTIIKDIKLQAEAEKQVHKIANKPLILRKKDSKYRGKLKVITLETSTNKEKKDDKDIDEESVVEMAASTPA